MKNLSLFIKPWLDWPTEKLIEKLKELAISEIEYPVRNGISVNPDNCEEVLPALQGKFNAAGIKIVTVGALGVDERIFKAMHKAGIELMRIMLPIGAEENYFDAEDRFVNMLSEATEYCKKYNTKVGIQPHSGRWVSTVMELKHLLERCDTKYIGAVWDTGHAGLAGEIPKKSLDIIYENIFLVNLKSAYWVKDNDEDCYKAFYTTGRECPCSWRDTLSCLNELGYKGGFCSHAEYTPKGCLKGYTNGEDSEENLKNDLEFIKEIGLFIN